ncbi:MAG: hypothetical protein C3F08_04045 [Candidatus Methylomirabilota bacterium]|nr:MAG: hypothetical protein C3F08_04045 [candidate division NC10 bacterium]
MWFPSTTKGEITVSKVHEVKDPHGLVVVLERNAWRHITSGHPEMRDRLGDILQAIHAPTFIEADPIDPDSRRYYWLKPISFGTYSKLYVMVIVSVDKEAVSGKVRTAHLVDKPKGGPVLWAAKK